MSVLKSKRKASQFEVFHHLYQVRRDITDLLLRDFGYSFEKAEQRLRKRFGGRGYTELTEKEQERYNQLKNKLEAFDDWFIYDERGFHCKQYLPYLYGRTHSEKVAPG